MVICNYSTPCFLISSSAICLAISHILSQPAMISVGGGLLETNKTRKYRNAMRIKGNEKANSEEKKASADGANISEQTNRGVKERKRCIDE